MTNAESELFPRFSREQLAVNGTMINAVRGGAGAPVLLLHGYPQTHVIWHRVAPLLAERFTVVCADLRGYGDSGKPDSDETHEPYSKRAMAQDQRELMRALGFERFALVGHDRGARVARRLALDYPDGSPGSRSSTSFRPRRSTGCSTRNARPPSGGTSFSSNLPTCPSG